MTFPGKAAEHALIQKLAAATKIPKDELVKEYLTSRGTNETLPVFRLPVLSERFGRGIMDPYFYCVTLGGKGSLNLLSLVEPTKWLKSPLREAFLTGQGYMAGTGQEASLCLSTYIVGTVWVTTYYPTGYSTTRSDDSLGGVVVRDPELMGSFLSQPARSFVREVLRVEPYSE